MPSKKKSKAPMTLQKHIRKRITPENSDGSSYSHLFRFDPVERDRERGSRVRRRVESTKGK